MNQDEFRHQAVVGIAEEPAVQEIIRRALDEDIGSGDASSLAVVDQHDRCRGRIVSRGGFALAGLDVAAHVFRRVDAAITASCLCSDGDIVEREQIVMEIAGPARGVLTAERTALNFLQRLTGIATTTRLYVEHVRESGAAILDTRKTTPTLRILEKYAVRCGGGENHRMGLFDRIMLKDNHLAHWRKHNAGDLSDMICSARDAYPDLAIEVEVETVEDCARVSAAAPEWILLDNMTIDQLRDCVKICDGRSRLEASGGITFETVAAVAATGVDAISIGALTHSSAWADFSLEFEE